MSRFLWALVIGAAAIGVLYGTPSGSVAGLLEEDNFNLDAEGWQVYDYNGLPFGTEGGNNVFWPVTWESSGGVGDSAYVWGDDSRWRIDTPETPDSILSFIVYRSWAEGQSLDIRDAEVSVYLRGDGLDLKGGSIYFWALTNGAGARYHYTSQPLQASEGSWGQKLTFVLQNDENLWHNSWQRYPSSPASLNDVLSVCDSYGCSFVGFPAGVEVTGRFAMDELELSVPDAPVYPLKTLCNFESPKYSLGNLNGQDGWSGTGSVVAKPSFMPSLEGTQAAALDTGATASKSLAGAGFKDTTPVSVVFGFDYTQIPEVYWYSEMHLKANDGGSVKPIAIFGAEWFGGNNLLYAHNGATPVEVANSEWNSVSTFLVDVTLDFAAQQYKTVWKDAATSAVLYDFGWYAFKNPMTLEQMEASGTLTFDIGSSGGNWTAYVDNIKLNYASLILGDANGDGKVDEVDAARLAANWLGSGGWAQGDFNEDGVVNDADATIMAANWHYGVSQASVPEPRAFAPLLAVLGSLLIMQYKRVKVS